jgi:hypothetical protein
MAKKNFIEITFHIRDKKIKSLGQRETPKLLLRIQICIVLEPAPDPVGLSTIGLTKSESKTMFTKIDQITQFFRKRKLTYDFLFFHLA